MREWGWGEVRRIARRKARTSRDDSQNPGLFFSLTRNDLGRTRHKFFKG